MQYSDHEIAAMANVLIGETEARLCANERVIRYHVDKTLPIVLDAILNSGR